MLLAPTRPGGKQYPFGAGQRQKVEKPRERLALPCFACCFVVANRTGRPTLLGCNKKTRSDSGHKRVASYMGTEDEGQGEWGLANLEK